MSGDPATSALNQTTNLAINQAWTFLMTQIGYLSSPQSNVDALRNAMGRLRARAQDVRNQIQVAEREGQACRNEVQQWLRRVDQLGQAVTEIQNKYEQRRCLAGCSFNCYSINKKAIGVLPNVRAEYEMQFESIGQTLAPGPVLEVPAPDTVLGMDSYLERIRIYLNDDSAGIIGIWGMGGVGKTTLLHNVNNDECLPSGGSRTNFDHVFWATASRELNYEKLRKDIAKMLGLTLPEDQNQQETAIFSFLKNKSFLFLLDDLWEPVDLKKLGIPPPRSVAASKQKRKVLFTTRVEGVCAYMDAQKKIKVECLNEDDAWLLFQEKVGEETIKSDIRILKLAKQVARECGGLPLALIVIGRAMSTKKTPQEWQNAMTLMQRSRPHEIRGIDQQMFPKLMFSYDSLPDDIIRDCFLCCSLWPEDYSIWKTDLIECWLGHGLIDENMFEDINEAYDSGHSIIGVLKAACLLEPGDDKDREVKMHDVIRDLSLWITSDYGMSRNKFMVRAGVTRYRTPQEEGQWKLVQRISLIQNEMEEFPHLPPNCTKLTTMMLQENVSLKRIPTDSFACMATLTYLDISYTTVYDIPPEIGQLVELQYLNLSHTNISELPPEMGTVKKLKYLLVRGIVFVAIPIDLISSLSMLRVLDLSHAPYENWNALEGFGRGLKALGIAVETVAALQTLATLSRVATWHLGIRKLLGLNQPLQLLSPTLLGSRNIWSSLELLRIEHCESLEELKMMTNNAGANTIEAKKKRQTGGGSSWSLQRLGNVELKDLPELRKITWTNVLPGEMLPSLAFLTVSACKMLNNVSWILRLPCLEELVLHRCSQMEQVIDEEENIGGGEDPREAATVPAFPSLRRLVLSELPQLRRITSSSFLFPSLESLKVIRCGELKKLPFRSEITTYKLKEIRGEKAWWDDVKCEDDTIKDALAPYFRSNDLR